MFDTPDVAPEQLPGHRAGNVHGNLGRHDAHAADAAMLRDRVTAAVGDIYLIDREVGRGGMAVVYAAEDIRLQRKVALKVLPPDLAFRPEVRERFVREAQTAARLNHPHIVPIYAVHETQGLVCFAMSLVEGESLAARILREPRPAFAFVANMLEQMADALAYAHASGVVHRDIKPDNVLLDKDSGRAMVTDFGIARAAESGSRLTQTGIAVGTPAFMSPEQAMGDKEVDGRSDVYSVGVIGYLMLTGKLPFEASTTPAMLMKQVSETPPLLRGLRPDAPRVLVEILDRCLAKRPSDRWESALQLRDTLRRVQRDGSLLSPNVGPHAAQALAPVVPPPSLSREAGDDKFGHRAEDWAPRRIVEPAPAPRQLPAVGALPPVPQLPPLPLGADRSAQRAWKKAQKDAVRTWRQSVKEQRKANSAVFVEQLKAQQLANLPAATPGKLAERVLTFRKHVKWLGASAAVGTASLLIGAPLNIEPLLIPAVGGLIASMVSLQLLTIDFFKLRKLGVSPLAAWREDWRQTAARLDTRTHADRLRELTERHAGPVVMQSPYGNAVRNAADDRLVIQEITSALTPEDRQLVPDVEPTAEALLERVGSLATGLERLDRDLPGYAQAELQSRIAAVEAEPAQAPDRERRLDLLTRQRTSLEDLQSRRATMQRQLESASMALRSLRFDIVKLRTMGVSATADDFTNATQEARAVSRDLGYVLDAAEETRRL
ncbi:serine/threonine-protein kinase [Gemmatimonas phototrophica]|uniref:serine/threonine-protein kinase n=1 Tax=Gemmatimonas phototrophica TaxID=1379270 RepID=UPI0006A75521|nr:serine/threonine-protein kinase [Gemmatimonas phototrophica]